MARVVFVLKQQNVIDWLISVNSEDSSQESKDDDDDDEDDQAADGNSSVNG